MSLLIHMIDSNLSFVENNDASLLYRGMAEIYKIQYISVDTKMNDQIGRSLKMSMHKVKFHFIINIRYCNFIKFIDIKYRNYTIILIDLGSRKREKRSTWNNEGLWRIRVMVVADQTMMWHYDNEEHVLNMYIQTLMGEVNHIFRYNLEFQFI